MTAIEAGLKDLSRQHPEWEPWLAVLRTVLRETANPEWDAAVPSLAQTRSIAPLLAEAKVNLEKHAIHRLTEQLIRVASLSGTRQMATLKSGLEARLDVFALFRASLNQDSEQLREIALAVGADPEAFQAVGALLAIPFLHACNRRWARSIAPSWMEGYCPMCGTWPVFGEVRGIERSRYLRCGRCDGEWQAQGLFCPYCGMTDHKQLVSLVPENSSTNSVIEACTRCRGYVKIVTTLQGSPPGKVILDDLATVELDVAAVEQGYRRPDGSGYSLDIDVVDKPSSSERMLSG